MPKYRLIFDFGDGRKRSLGTIVHPDDEAAIAGLSQLDLQGASAELWRPDRKRFLARKDVDGTVLLTPSS